jgi:hypothetical protein
MKTIVRLFSDEPDQVPAQIFIHKDSECESLSVEISSSSESVDLVMDIKTWKAVAEKVLGRVADLQRCTCPKACDCEDIGRGLFSNECPIHNDYPQPAPDCPVHMARKGREDDAKL